jgi:putative ABC transport system permease protein
MTSNGESLGAAVRFARRELRGGLKGFRVFLACLSLGVAAIAGVGSVTEGLLAGIADSGQALLGGDVEVSLRQRRASDAERAWLLRESAHLSETAELRAMARPIASEAAPSLVELKAVDGNYPLFGALKLDPPQPLSHAFAKSQGRFGALAEESLLSRLKLSLGDALAVGDATFTVAGIIRDEPDRASGGLQLAPRLLIGMDALEATGLVVPGSLISFAYRLALPTSDASNAALDAFKARLDQAWPRSLFRVADRNGAAPGLRRFLNQANLFFSLVALTALAVGGVGVGNAVKGYLDGKRAVVATLKCLGATGGFILKVYLLQVMTLALLAIVIGLGAGALIPQFAQGVIGAALPVKARLSLYLEPLALAAVYGVLTALAFSLWPLARVREIPAGFLFRDLVAPLCRWPRPLYVGLCTLSLTGLAALAVGFAPYRSFALWFLAAAVASFAVLRLTALVALLLARYVPRPRWPALRFALANLLRPGTPAPSIVLSFGLGLTLLVTVALIDGNIRSEISRALPGRAPAFFFVDIQRNELAAFRQLLSRIPGVRNIESVPSLRGRIRAINGVAADPARFPPEARWGLGDRGVTYARTPPSESFRLVAGQWWPENYAGPPLVSLDAGIAHGLSIKVGDRITLMVLSREITAEVASLRDVDYRSGGINFSIIASPGVFEAAPHTFLATAHAPRGAEEHVLRAVTSRFPNITVVAVREAIERVEGLLRQLAHAIEAASVVTLLVGVLVLAGALAAGHRHRVYDAVMLKVLGATRGRLIWAYMLEFLMLGALTAIIAAALGTVAAYLVVTRVMDMPFTFLPGLLTATLAAALGAIILLGLAGTARTLSVRPAAVLRAP